MTTLNESLNEARLNSYEKFEQRLKTFKIFKWFAKPAEFSPIECAKHGWINLTKDSLKCVACSNIFYYFTKTPNRVSINSSSEEVTNARVLVDKHNVNCPWRTLRIPDSLIEIDVYDEEKVFENFSHLKDSLQKCQRLPFLVSSTCEKFACINDLADNLLSSPAKNLSLSIHLKEKFKTQAILASCGWIYREDKDVLNCSKCLRSAGVWMYKRADDDELQADKDMEDEQNISNISDLVMFHSTDPYDEETAVKTCVSNIVSIIELEEQTQLKNAYSSKHENFPTKKRKLDQLNESNSRSLASSVEVAESNKKIFDPIHEHFQWCPWISVKSDKTNTLKLVCEIYFDIVCKQLKNQTPKQTTDAFCINLPDMTTHLTRSKSNINDDVIVNSQLLLDKVKSVQSLLINCTSQYTLKC